MAGFYFRPATSKEAQLISRTTRLDPHLAFRPLSVIKKSISRKNIFCCQTPNGALIGWIEIYPIWKNNWGMSTLYVFPRWRNAGFASRLIKFANQVLKSKNVYTATSHLGLIKILTALRYRQIPLQKISPLIVFSWLATRYYHPASWLKFFIKPTPDLKVFSKTAKIA